MTCERKCSPIGYCCSGCCRACWCSSTSTIASPPTNHYAFARLRSSLRIRAVGGNAFPVFHSEPTRPRLAPDHVDQQRRLYAMTVLEKQTPGIGRSSNECSESSPPTMRRTRFRYHHPAGLLPGPSAFQLSHWIGRTLLGGGRPQHQPSGDSGSHDWHPECPVIMLVSRALHGERAAR